MLSTRTPASTWKRLWKAIWSTMYGAAMSELSRPETGPEAAGDPTIELDLDSLELDDDDAIDEAVNAIRELLREAPLVLRGAPRRSLPGQFEEKAQVIPVYGRFLHRYGLFLWVVD